MRYANRILFIICFFGICMYVSYDCGTQTIGHGTRHIIAPELVNVGEYLQCTASTLDTLILKQIDTTIHTPVE